MTPDDLKADLEQRVEVWASMNHPSILERFVLRNGKPMESTKLKGRPLKQGLCFRNATWFSERGVGTYTEGFACRLNIPFPIHHAWVTVDGKAMDPTWRKPEEAVYYGVEFSREEVIERSLATGCYGVLVNGSNHQFALDLMYKRDPKFQAIIEEVIGRSLAA